MSALPDVSQGSAPVGGRRTTRRRTAGDLFVQFLLPAAALALLGFAGWYVWTTRPVVGQPPPPIAPARNPFADALAAAGVVEARTENIAVGSPTAGVVVEVFVTVDEDVKPGDPLFRLDDRPLRGDLAVKRAAVSQAKSELVRLEAEPRKERIPVQAAVVAEARAAVARERDALRRADLEAPRHESLDDPYVGKLAEASDHAPVQAWTMSGHHHARGLLFMVEQVVEPHPLVERGEIQAPGDHGRGKAFVDAAFDEIALDVDRMQRRPAQRMQPPDQRLGRDRLRFRAEGVHEVAIGGEADMAIDRDQIVADEDVVLPMGLDDRAQSLLERLELIGL